MPAPRERSAGRDRQILRAGGLALGLSAGLHLLLIGWGQGVLSPGTSVRPAGAVTPPMQVEFIRARPLPVDPLAAPATASARPRARASLSGAQAGEEAHVSRPAPDLVSASAASPAPTSSMPATESSIETAPPPEPAPSTPDDAGEGAALSAPAFAPPPAPEVRNDLAPRLLTPPPDEKPGEDRPPPAPESGLLDPVYYPSARLSVRAAPLDAAGVDVPAHFFDAFGNSVLTLYIGATGVVDRVEMRRSGLPAELQEAVVASFRSLRFAPAEIDGRPVASFMTIEANVSSKRRH
jgi:hypothetical protein